MENKEELIRSFYDAETDDLTVKIGTIKGIYANEIFDGIFLILDEDEQEISGFQILNYKKMSDYVLKKYLPGGMYDILQTIGI